VLIFFVIYVSVFFFVSFCICCVSRETLVYLLSYYVFLIFDGRAESINENNKQCEEVS